MEAVVEDTPIVTNWRENALWVQDTVLVRRMSHTPEGSVVLKRQTGETICLTVAAFEDMYFAFGDDEVFKPAFSPCRAICFDHDVRIPDKGRHLHVPAGDAVLELPDGRLRVLPRERFNLAYRIVGHGGPNPPVAPFRAGRARQMPNP